MFAAEMPSWHSILMAAFQTECVGVHAGCSDTLLGAYVGHDGFIVSGAVDPTQAPPRRSRGTAALA